MEVFLVYLWLKLDTFIALTTVLWIILALLALLSSLVILDSGGKLWDREKEEWQQNKGPGWRKWRKSCLISALILCIFSVAIPSSKETAILVGTSIAVDVAKSPEGAKVAQLLRGKANELLDEQIKKLEKK